MSKHQFKKIPALDAAKPAENSLFIATPAYGGNFTGHYVQSIMALSHNLWSSGVAFKWEPLLAESHINRARNRLVAAFLAEKRASHLLFIDSDIGFLPKDVAALTRGNFDVVCGLYPMKSYGWEAIRQAAVAGVKADELKWHGALYAMNPTPASLDADGFDVIEKNGGRYVEVMDGATGFMLISRGALEKYIAAYGEKIKYVADYQPNRGETHYEVFGSGPDPQPSDGAQGRRWLSEDYWFSRQWQAIGGKIYACLDCKLSHTGMHVFHGNPDLVLAPMEQPAPPADEGAQAEDDVVFVDPA